MARRRPRKREKQLLACRRCGRSFEGRANALRCSERCRQLAWRDKRASEIKAGREALAALAKIRLAVLGEAEDSTRQFNQG